MKALFAVVPLLALAGCSSYQVDHYAPVPQDRLSPYAEVSDGGRILVERDPGWMGGGCYVGLQLDRKLAARIHVGERATFSVTPGTHVVGIVPDPEDKTLCGKGRLLREQAVEVTAGSESRFRIVSEANAGFDIRPDTP